MLEQERLTSTLHPASILRMQKLEKRISLATRALALALLTMVTAHVALSLTSGKLCYIGGDISSLVNGAVGVEGDVSAKVGGAVGVIGDVGVRGDIGVSGDVSSNVSGSVAADVRGDVGVTGDVTSSVSGNIGAKVNGLVDVSGTVSSRVTGLVDVNNGIGAFRVVDTGQPPQR